MSSTYIVVEGLSELDFVPEMTKRVQTALVRALNKAATSARTLADRTIREQINFSASYLRPSAKRLWVSKQASQNSLESVVQGRERATSLARFSRQKPMASGKRRRGGVKVTVKPGRQRTLKRAFLIRLRSNNIGLAMRTSGGPPKGAYKPKLIGKDLYLLYGPSVNQALLSTTTGRGVIEEMTPAVMDKLETEFWRQYDLLGAA